MILKLSHHIIDNEQILEEAKIQLLQSTAPDAIARICETSLSRDDQEKFCKLYYCSHMSTLGDAIQNTINRNNQRIPMLLVTTQSRLLTKEGNDLLTQELKMPVKILPLQQMSTESQFSDLVEHFLVNDVIRGDKRKNEDNEIAMGLKKFKPNQGLKRKNEEETEPFKVLLVQAQVQQNTGSLIECARYVVQNKLTELDRDNLIHNNACIAFVLQVCHFYFILAVFGSCPSIGNISANFIFGASYFFFSSHTLYGTRSEYYTS